MDISKRMLAEMPVELEKFLNTLTDNELDQLEKIPRLVAKVYQAGAIFSIDMGLKLGKELEKEKNQ